MLSDLRWGGLPSGGVISPAMSPRHQPPKRDTVVLRICGGQLRPARSSKLLGGAVRDFGDSGFANTRKASWHSFHSNSFKFT